jgi:hypothetical protein
MVAMNSIPQQEVAKGSGQRELARAKPTALSRLVAKKPWPSRPSGLYSLLISTLVVMSIDVLNTHERWLIEEA